MCCDENIPYARCAVEGRRYKKPDSNGGVLKIADRPAALLKTYRQSALCLKMNNSGTSVIKYGAASFPVMYSTIAKLMIARKWQTFVDVPCSIERF